MKAERIDSPSERQYWPSIETHLLESRHVRQTFKVQVMLPARLRGEQTRYPVIYSTDGNFSFDVLKGLSWSMQLSGRDAPRFILVGISYPGDCPLAGALLRARDLTFPRYPRLSTAPVPFEGVPTVEEGSKDFYGAEDFQRFIAEELIPLIDDKYPTLAGDRSYFGHSAGGGFGLFTMLSNSRLFSKYIISSPGITYHGESSAGVRYDDHDFLLQWARQFIEEGGSLDNVQLYMSVGTEEEFEPALVQWRLTSSFYRMVSLLRSAPGLRLKLMTEAFVGETHNTVWPMSYMHGVQAIFGTRAWRSDATSMVR
jgi:uncharacterized protein